MTRAATREPAKPRRPRAGRAAPFWRRGVVARWGWAVLLALAVLVLVPLVHALFGDVGVLLFGGLGLGFLVGRWTAKRA